MVSKPTQPQSARGSASGKPAPDPLSALQVFDRLEVAGLWADTVVDDVTLGRRMREHGLRITPCPFATLDTPGQTRALGLIELLQLGLDPLLDRRHGRHGAGRRAGRHRRAG